MIRGKKNEKSSIIRRFHQTEIKAADVVHWNNGLWDVCDIFGDGAFSSLDEYMKNMLRIADILLEWGCKVFFATTTPTFLKCLN